MMNVTRRERLEAHMRTEHGWPQERLMRLNLTAEGVRADGPELIPRTYTSLKAKHDFDHSCGVFKFVAATEHEHGAKKAPTTALTKCRCGWALRRKGTSWQHVGVGTVMCPPRAMWTDPSLFKRGAKGAPATTEPEL